MSKKVFINGKQVKTDKFKKVKLDQKKDSREVNTLVMSKWNEKK